MEVKFLNKASAYKEDDNMGINLLNKIESKTNKSINSDSLEMNEELLKSCYELLNKIESNDKFDNKTKEYLKIYAIDYFNEYFGKKHKIIKDETIYELIKLTKNGLISWISMEYFKKFLGGKDTSLGEFEYFDKYLRYLLEDGFIFDCSCTYLAYYENVLYVCAKRNYPDSYRVDRFDFKKSVKWEKMDSSAGIVLRLRNVIDAISTETNDEMCIKLLESICSENINT